MSDLFDNTYGSKWTHDETVLALGLYFQIPFGKINRFHPEVVKLAKIMHRSPAALSMKMGNIGRCDPTLAEKHITGLPNGAKMELTVWNEYAGKREDLAEEYSRLRLALASKLPIENDDLIKTPPGLDRIGLSKYRINQSFFRNSVLSAYNNTCCITGLNTPELLIASHIKPWAACEDGNDRTDTQNGLCLNALHDSAFDKGFFTLDEDYRIVLSNSLKDAVPHDVYSTYFVRHEGQQIRLPDRGKPSKIFLNYHREYVFDE